MKSLFLTVFMFSFLLVGAQNNTTDVVKPIYEKEGDLVKVTLFHDSGEIREQGFYDVDKKLTGKWTQFDITGKKTTIAHYYKGNKVGKWFVWNQDRLLEVDYENSKVASVSEWKDNSTIADN